MKLTFDVDITVPDENREGKTRPATVVDLIPLQESGELEKLLNEKTSEFATTNKVRVQEPPVSSWEAVLVEKQFPIMGMSYPALVVRVTTDVTI